MNEFKKFKLFINPIEEEKWINEQLSKGYKLINLSHVGIYTFISTEEAYTVRIDYRTISNLRNYHEYIDLHEQFGWSHVFGYRHGVGNQYWQKIEDGNDELFSDTETQTAYYKRIQHLIVSLIIMFSIYFLTLDGTRVESMFNTPFTLINSIGYIFLATLIFIYTLTYVKIKHINTQNED